MKLHRNSFGQLVLVLANGAEHVGVVPVRAFPIAAPGEGVSMVATDGHELAWIDRIDALDADVRALVEQELALRDFVPEIRRLKSVSTFGTPSVWDVETDRGDTTLVLEGEEDIRRLARGMLMIASGNGVHFRIADLSALDRQSRRLIERFL